MRLNEEISDHEEEEEEESENLQPQKLVVGYALTSKKKKSFLQPKLEVLAGNKGIIFVAIDLNRPLSDQGPFDVVLHKMSGKEWSEIIERLAHLIMSDDQIVEIDLSRIQTRHCASSFEKNALRFNRFKHQMCAILNPLRGLRLGIKCLSLKHPEVTVLDPPDAIKHLHNRQSMLQDVADLNLSDCHGKVCVPKQMVITKDSISIPDEVFEAGLKLPLVAKPLVVDGSARSHELFVAYDRFSLAELEPPMVLQEFVNHGGVLFKIYIVGETIKVVRRFSLPNVSKCELSKVAGVIRFPRVSSAAASADDADLDPRIAELPPRPLLERLARELRLRLGLRLFNIDMIREHGTRDVFYVIDINYFPGYGKMPDYEHVFTDFLLSLLQSKYKKRSPIAAA